ncbi:MAG TPA: L-threonylcarbamoyladenylate synthase [bacterium]|nr:L-threonylcarbamoyladenylate synthase [bacterium]HPQ66473.1 L-threonylcarbamoyladenylate synthase [bacterium]
MTVFPIDPARPEPRALAAAAAAVRRGGLVVFPTETVYGIGLDGENPAAVERLYRLKGRPPEKPLARLIADPEEARELVAPRWRPLLARFWPGPLTLVLTAPSGRPVGFRCPDHPTARALVRAAGVAFAATSANRSGENPVSTGAAAASIFGDRVDVILDAGAVGGGEPSTVVDLTGERPVVVRTGPVTPDEIGECLGAVPEAGAG